MRRYGLWTFLLATMLQTGGCATMSLTSKIDNDDYSYTGPNEIEDVTVAYRNSAGNVTICIKGALVQTNDSRRGNIIEYSIRFPTASMWNLKTSDFESIMRHRPMNPDVQQNCPAPEKDMTPLPIHTMRTQQSMTIQKSPTKAEEPGPSATDKRFMDMSDNELTMFFENRAEGPAIYRLVRRQDSPGQTVETSLVIYVHETPAFESRSAVEIDATLHKFESNTHYYLLMPFAVVFDIITFPVQFLAMYTYPE